MTRVRRTRGHMLMCAVVAVVAVVAAPAAARATTVVVPTTATFYQEAEQPASVRGKRLVVLWSWPAVRYLAVPTSPRISVDPITSPSELSVLHALWVDLDLSSEPAESAVSEQLYVVTATTGGIFDVSAMTVVGRVCEVGQLCVFADATDTRHEVELLVGANAQWKNRQMWLWDNGLSAEDFPATCSADQDGGGLRDEARDHLQGMGLDVFRYPGGTVSDFFRWDEAVGPVASRVPQAIPDDCVYDADDADLGLVCDRQCPVFGSDELVQVAAELGVSEAVISTNVNMTGEDMARWLGHFVEKGGLIPTYWLVGNENYLCSTDYHVAFPTLEAYQELGYCTEAKFLVGAMTAREYVDRFAETKAHMDALVASWGHPFEIKLGVIAVVDEDRDVVWNQRLFQELADRGLRPDFIDAHFGYLPFSSERFDPDRDWAAYSAAAAGQQVVRGRLAQLSSDVAERWPGGLPLTLSEFAYWNLPDLSDPELFLAALRNQYHGMALYVAGLIQLLAREAPQVALATIMDIQSVSFQGLLRADGLLDMTNPMKQAAGFVFELYAGLRGGVVLDAPVLRQGAPENVFANEAFGEVPAMSGNPVVDAMVVNDASAGETRVYAINYGAERTVEVAVDNSGDGVTPPHVYLDAIYAPFGAGYDAPNLHLDGVPAYATQRDSCVYLGQREHVPVDLHGYSVTRLVFSGDPDRCP